MIQYFTMSNRLIRVEGDDLEVDAFLSSSNLNDRYEELEDRAENYHTVDIEVIT